MGARPPPVVTVPYLLPKRKLVELKVREGGPSQSTTCAVREIERCRPICCRTVEYSTQSDPVQMLRYSVAGCGGLRRCVVVVKWRERRAATFIHAAVVYFNSSTARVVHLEHAYFFSAEIHIDSTDELLSRSKRINARNASPLLPTIQHPPIPRSPAGRVATYKDLNLTQPNSAVCRQCARRRRQRRLQLPLGPYPRAHSGAGSPRGFPRYAISSSPWTTDYIDKNFTAYSIYCCVYCNRQLIPYCT